MTETVTLKKKLPLIHLYVILKKTQDSEEKSSENKKKLLHDNQIEFIVNCKGDNINGWLGFK